MSDMIEKVARELRKVKLWDGNPIVSDAQLTDDEVNDLARTAIAAHTAALVEGAGETAAELVICGEADRTLAHQAAATIAALQAENERQFVEFELARRHDVARAEAAEDKLATAREEGARLGIEAAAKGLEEAYFINFWRADGMNVEQARIHAKARVRSAICSLDPAAITKTEHRT